MDEGDEEDEDGGGEEEEMEVEEETPTISEEALLRVLRMMRPLNSIFERSRHS